MKPATFPRWKIEATGKLPTTIEAPTAEDALTIYRQRLFSSLQIKIELAKGDQQ